MLWVIEAWQFFCSTRQEVETLDGREGIQIQGAGRTRDGLSCPAGCRWPSPARPRCSVSIISSASTGKRGK